MRQQVLFRVDGNTTIGFGHYTRCIALAQLLGNGFDCRFFSKEVPPHLQSVLLQNTWDFVVIQEEDTLLNYCSEQTIVVVDHYELGEVYRKEILKKGAKLVIIDDAMSGTYSANLLINHAPGLDADSFKLTEQGQKAVGCNYALLRPEFQEAARSNNVSGDKYRVFVCFGGADPQNLTLQVVSELVDAFPEIHLEVVIAADKHPQLNKLSKRIHTHANLTANELIACMRKCTKAVVPASGLLVETLAVGLEVVSGYFIDNQRQMYEGYKALNAFSDAQHFQTEMVVKALLTEKTSPPQLIDGFAPLRFRNMFRSLTNTASFQLRYALPEDAETTYKWVNDPVVRAHSFTQDFVPFEHHKKWFLTKLRDASCIYYLAEVDGAVAGSIRFDVTDSEAVISYLLDPTFHGKKLGDKLLGEGIEFFLGEAIVAEKKVNKIIGKVQSANIPSVKLFEKRNFSCASETEETVLFTRNIPL